MAGELFPRGQDFQDKRTRRGVLIKTCDTFIGTSSALRTIFVLGGFFAPELKHTCA
jgi:hypothetical protein